MKNRSHAETPCAHVSPDLSARSKDIAEEQVPAKLKPIVRKPQSADRRRHRVSGGRRLTDESRKFTSVGATGPTSQYSAAQHGPNRTFGKTAY